MTLINLHRPVQGGEALLRPHLFPGRSMGEVEFDRRQVYADARLAPLATVSTPGILRGLRVETGSGAAAGEEAGEGLRVDPGLAISGNGTLLGLYQPLNESWSTLVTDFVAAHPGETTKGIYYLTLNRSSHVIDATQEIDACQRFDLDRLRDTSHVVIGTLRLRKLAVTDNSVLDRRRFENLVAAMHADGAFLRTMRNAVPVGLVGIDGARRVRWFSQTAGRYLSETHAGYRVLARLLREAFDEASQRFAAGDGNAGETLIQYFTRTVKIDFLPAAGELPPTLLRDIDTRAVSVGWLPAHLRLDMVPVPDSAVPELLDRHIGRRVTDLRRTASGEHLRLLLAVDDDAYARDLFDIPSPDKVLSESFYRHHMSAHSAWRRWSEEFAQLYQVHPEADMGKLGPAEIDPPRAADPPIRPDRFYARLISAAHAEHGIPEGEMPPAPYRKVPPNAPTDYNDWLVVNEEGERVPPPPALPNAHGLVIQAAIAEEELERLDNRIRAIRERLEKTRDFLLLQRQQLDSQTVSLASLAGGIAGDGSGLKVARTLPFGRLKVAEAVPASAAPDGRPDGGAAAAGGALGSSIPFTAAFGPASDWGAATPTGTPTGGEKAPMSTGIASMAPGFSGFSAMRLSVPHKPQQASAFELALNTIRLDRLAEIPKISIAAPAFDYKIKRFGVMEHIRPELNEYRSAYRGINDLLDTLDTLFTATEARALRKILFVFGTLTAPDDIEAKANDDQRVSAHYEALFNAGKLLTKHISFMEQRHSRLEIRYDRMLRLRILKEAQIAKLSARIVVVRDRLDALDARRVEQLGDYGVAQRLVDEDLRRVLAETRERARILTQEVRGLYFVRTRSAEVSLALADPLELRYATGADAVPGCDWETDPDLPDELAEFFDAVLEVPVDNWAVLRPLQVKLPPLRRIETAFTVRKERLRVRQSVRTADSAGKVGQRLYPLTVQSRSLIASWSAMRLPPASLSALEFAGKTAQVLSLEDVLSTGSGELRRSAEELRLGLEQAVACLVKQLNLVPPSIRLQWSELAESDRLIVDDVSRWPGLERAGREEFAAARTILELVAWWFRRLVEDASAEAKAALRNMIRAVVIFTALGDPNEMVRGRVRTPPRRFAVGEILKLDLERAVRPGTLLQLFDRQQQGIAVLRADDRDSSGTRASIVSLTRPDVAVTSEFTVLGGKAGRLVR